MFQSLAEPVLTYGSEIWGPDSLDTLESTLTAPLLAGGGGLAARIPTKETTMTHKTL